MSQPTTTHSHDRPAPSKPRGIHPGWVLAGFFAILMAFNISFLVIAVQHPPKLVPKAAPSEASPALDASTGPSAGAPSR